MGLFENCVYTSLAETFVVVLWVMRVFPGLKCLFSVFWVYFACLPLQIFPARKVRNSGVLLTATDSDALSIEKKKKQQKKNKSPGRRGSLEGFIVRDRQGNGDDLLPLSNAVGGEKRGGASEVTESSITLAKPAVSLQWVSNNCLRSTTESRLQRCEAAAACVTKSGSERTITTEEAGEHGDIGAQPRPWKVVQKAVESVTAIEEVARTAGPVDLQVAKQNKGDTLEDDDTRKSHQLTQFANEFLAICCRYFSHLCSRGTIIPALIIASELLSLLHVCWQN